MVNNSVIMGRLTADPELRQNPNGVSVCTFTVAVERNRASQGQERQTDFIPVVAWKQTAEFVCKYFGKGKMIAIVGNLRTSSYDDKRYPDVKHYVMELYADSVNFCGDKQAQNAAPPQKQIPYSKPEIIEPPVQRGNLDGFEEVIGGEDLPF
ncbi:MAG: single-stranded DNA-binding protein [Ruminococcus sp.]|nr:single-stranded DNA-binding protein [Ruminococcus sp.]MCM1380589.1 single-stranded DNA-binding protein [Muribaculaceae bacterium]MCM1479772.1 single-stranded DNA-binding protein [Muribaculaceae bacterium]